ncbi:hypothetical protein DBV14_02520 [Variovorax sp. KBW07]|nr:hypothetical protein DBV14_02520 [Variovorax sp. KBW07]
MSEPEGKKNIKEFDKTYQYLLDPELRKKEAGDAQLVIEGAVFSGVDLQGEIWQNIKFTNCDFVGAYQIKPEAIERSVFEGCRFSGIFNFGILRQVGFFRCLIAKTSHVVGDVGSVGVVFDSCEQMGSDTDANHWGSFGAYGEVEFIKCKARLTNLSGETRHVIRECDFEDVRCGINNDDGGSHVLIENSRLRGRFSMVVADLRSLTVRDTVVGTLDLNDAKVKGAVLIERVQGGVVRGYVKHANSFTVRNSKIMGDGQDVFDAYAGGIKTIEIDGTVFGSGTAKGANNTDGVTIAGGTGADLAKPRRRVTERLTIRNSTIPQLNVDHIHAAEVRIENSDIAEANLSNSVLGVLRLDNARFAGALDMSNTRVRDLKQSGGTEVARLGSQLKLEGSNIKLPRR